MPGIHPTPTQRPFLISFWILNKLRAFCFTFSPKLGLTAVTSHQILVVGHFSAETHTLIGKRVTWMPAHLFIFPETHWSELRYTVFLKGAVLRCSGWQTQKVSGDNLSLTSSPKWPVLWKENFPSSHYVR